MAAGGQKLEKSAGLFTVTLASLKLVVADWKVAASEDPVSALVSVGEVCSRFEGGRFEELLIGTVFLQVPSLLG